LDKTFFSAKLNQETPPSVIHGWKATDLPFMMVKRKKYFFHPVKRQIFGDASGKTSAPILTVCHTLKCEAIIFKFDVIKFPSHPNYPNTS